MGFLAALGGIAKTFFAKKAVQQIVVPAAVNALVGRANQKAANKASVAAYKQNKVDASNKFVDMNKAAQKAGFNPLTVLRATGGAGFGSYGAPILSKRAFGLEFAANSISGFANMKANEPIEKYNQQVRRLDLESRKLDIKLAKKQLEGMKNPYEAYGNTIPVRVGNNTQQLDVTVARRLGILPNDRITAGDLEEIRGEIHGGIQAGVESDIGGAILPRTPGGNTPVGTNWMDNFVGKITNIINSMPNTPVVPPLSDKRWNDEWKNHVN